MSRSAGVHKDFTSVCLTWVQACKSFITHFVLPSATRTAALTRFLNVLSKSCTPEDAARDKFKGADEYEGLGGIVNGKVQQAPNSIFRRLHILYIVHDLLCFVHLKLRKDSRHAQAFRVDPAALDHVYAIVPVLTQLAVCADSKPSYASKEALGTVESLLTLWKEHEVLPEPTITELQASVQKASNMAFSELLSSLADDEAQAALVAQRAKEEESKWILPKTHHLPYDPDAPWHELPAANGLFQRRTQGFPLRASGLPRGGYSLRNGGRKADDELIKDVQDLLSEAKHCFDKYTNAKDVQDIDALGNYIWKPHTGRKTRNHWGWSYEGIEQRKRMQEEKNGDELDTKMYGA